MEIKQIKIQDIKPYEKNAKKHTRKQIDQVANSIKRFGFVQPLVVDKNNELIIGHCRLEASKKLGMTEVPTLKLEDLSEEEVKALRLADNKLNESAWDMDLVIPELKGLSDDLLDLTGFDRDLIIEPDEKDDEVPEVPKKPRSKLGDLYELGNHRVLCGDSTNDENIKKLFGKEKAKIIFTSPPYNMARGMYENYEDNLKREEYIDFNLKVVNNWKKYLYGFLFWNISYNKNSRDEFIEILYRIIKESGLKFLELIVWNKKSAMPIVSREAMTRTYEDILVVGNDDSIREDIEMGAILRNSKEAFFNTKTRKWLNNYWEITVNNTQLDNHKACYPVALPLRAILIMTNENEIVADPFLGSGTTLIASEKTGRICYGMELDPCYVDVIVQRYVDYTGDEKIKLNGKEIIWQRTK
jgi:DNA modification methylase